jgi:hypothetical protein
LSSGDYSYTLINSSGCDSIANISYTIIISGINNMSNYQNKYLIKITDVLGREVKAIRNKTLLYIYSDGSVEKKIFKE